MKDEFVRQITGFLQRIGLPVRFEAIEAETFLPGLTIADGTLVVDAARIEWPGDLLHEAGHIALTPPSRRATVGGKLDVTPAEEMAALAWSYAAAVEAGIDPAVVFHEGGYKSNGSQLQASYASGSPMGGPGVPILQWYGMTRQFPQMDSWFRECEDPIEAAATLSAHS